LESRLLYRLEEFAGPVINGPVFTFWSSPMKHLALMLAACLVLASCETIKGVGRDLQNAGEAIDDALD